MFFRLSKQLFIIVFVFIGIAIFSWYLKFLFQSFCLKWGYTLCAAIGEDFFALYQASYNFFHNIFIYGELAQSQLVTPYFMTFKYFPITPFLIGWPFLILFPTPLSSYHGYLIFVLLFYLLGFFTLYLVSKKFQADSITKLFLFVFWFTFFPILSDLRMGQYNLISSLFFLFSVIFLLFSKKNLSAFSWLMSLIFKPIALLNFVYYLKTKNKIAIWGFVLCFVIFTSGYLLYHSLHYPQAINDFLKTIFLSGDRRGWQIHYVDNFSVNSFLAELFYDSSPLLFAFVSKGYFLIIITIFLLISYQIKLQEKETIDFYYLLYTFSTLIMLHKEVWESWLSSWIVIVALLLIMVDNNKEKIFLFVNGFLLGAPSLFYFYEMNKTNLLRSLMITAKACPQLFLYGYLIYKLYFALKEQSR